MRNCQLRSGKRYINRVVSPAFTTTFITGVFAMLNRKLKESHSFHGILGPQVQSQCSGVTKVGGYLVHSPLWSGTQKINNLEWERTKSKPVICLLNQASCQRGVQERKKILNFAGAPRCLQEANKNPSMLPIISTNKFSITIYCRQSEITRP